MIFRFTCFLKTAQLGNDDNVQCIQRLGNLGFLYDPPFTLFSPAFREAVSA